MEQPPMSQGRTGRAPRVGFLEGSAPSLSSDTEVLLRSRLRALVVLVAAAMGLFLARDLLGFGPTTSAWHLGGLSALFLSLAALGTLLSSGFPLNLRGLRIIEFTVLGAQTAWMAYVQYSYVVSWTQQGNQTFVLGQIDAAALQYFALIVSYGVLIPNTWARALRVAGFVAVVPFVVFGAMSFREPGSTAIQLSTAEYVTLGVEIGIGVMIAVASAHIIHSLRKVAFEAQQMGQYLLEDKIGAGGMGEVWKAEHRFLARPAAIKLIRPDVAGAQTKHAARNLLRRFEREAQATAALRSVHTIELYDFGISEDGVFFYVMELLDGQDLDEMVKRSGPLPPSRVVYLLRQACESLAEAHHMGLVHRDIKPANIYACRLGVSSKEVVHGSS